MTDTTAQPIEAHKRHQTNQELINYHIQQITGRANLTSQIKVFKELTGNATLAQMLTQLIYWSDRSSRADGFVYKSASDWINEVQASRHQVRRFKKLPFIITELHRANSHPTTHYKVDFEKLIPALYNRKSQTNLIIAIKPQSTLAASSATIPIATPSIPDPSQPTPIQEDPTPRPKPKIRYAKLHSRGKITPIQEPHNADHGAKMPLGGPSSPPDGGKITPIEDLQMPDMGVKIPLIEPTPTPDGGKISPILGQNQPGIGAKLPQDGGKNDKSLTLITTINTASITNNKLKENKQIFKEKESSSQPYSNLIFGSVRISQVLADQNPALLERLKAIDEEPSPDAETFADNPSTSKANYQEFLAELADLTGFNLAIKPNAERLNRVASQLISAGYAVSDLKNYYNYWIEKDWRWKKSGTYPTPEIVLTDIAQVKKLQDSAFLERQKYLRWLR